MGEPSEITLEIIADMAATDIITAEVEDLSVATPIMATAMATTTGTPTADTTVTTANGFIAEPSRRAVPIGGDSIRIAITDIAKLKPVKVPENTEPSPH